MKQTEIIESALIVVALLSLWPVILGHRSLLYSLWLISMLGAMVWLAVRRLRRIRAAADEAKRIRDETEKPQRPPSLDG